MSDETPSSVLCKLFKIKHQKDDEGTTRTELYSFNYGKATFIGPLILIGAVIGIQFIYHKQLLEYSLSGAQSELQAKLSE